MIDLLGTWIHRKLALQLFFTIRNETPKLLHGIDSIPPHLNASVSINNYQCLDFNVKNVFLREI